MEGRRKPPTYTVTIKSGLPADVIENLMELAGQVLAAKVADAATTHPDLTSRAWQVEVTGGPLDTRGLWTSQYPPTMPELKGTTP